MTIAQPERTHADHYRMTSRPVPRRPSPMWTVGIAIAGLVALAGIGGGALYQQTVSTPVGEGRLFKTDAVTAHTVYSAAVADGATDDGAVRAARNELGIEGLGVVSDEGEVVAATAPELIGDTVGPFLSDALARGRFAAQAVQLQHPLSLDGVTEWVQGDVVYAVVEPLPDRRGLLLVYDISELLARRSQDSSVRPLTIQLVVAGMLAATTAAGLWVARQRTRQRIDEAEREAALLAEHAAELESRNAELEVARREAERALALAEETNRIRSEFVLMINHELRTPLTSVVTGTETLLDQPHMAPEDRRELLDHVARDGRRLVELMSQMLTVARVENRSLEFTLTRVPASMILERLRGRWEGLTVEMDTDITIDTDPDTLTQMLWSLVENARTHGAEHASISVVTRLPFAPDLMLGEPDPSHGYLVVRDDGPGIDHSFLPRAFEKFEKRGRTSGTGLGLYLVRLMCDAIDGCLAVRTGPEGTAIAVGVPTAAAVLEVARS